MMQTVPIWLEYVKAFGPPFVAIAAVYITAAISIRQWRTANEKVVLDLFDRRMGIYSDSKLVIGKIAAFGTNNINDDMVRDFEIAREKAKFLFGSDVNEYLGLISEKIRKVRSAERRLKQAPKQIIDKLVDEINEYDSEFDDFFTKYDALIEPYVKMDQKLSKYRGINLWSK